MFDYIKFLRFDKNVILYRKELNAITGSVTASILLQQIIYRSEKKGKFYKFRQPCKHDKYQAGDSWLEELGFGLKEFDNALERIGFKEGNTHNKLKREEALVIYYTDMDRLTWYWLNEEVLNKRLSEIYVESLPAPDAEVEEKMMTEHVEPAKESKKGKRSGNEKLHLFQDSDIFEFEEFCNQVTAGTSGEKYKKYDLAYYHEVIANWSASKSNKKTDWVATSRNWMRTDDKPKLLTLETPVNFDENTLTLRGYIFQLFSISEEQSQSVGLVNNFLSKMKDTPEFGNFKKQFWDYYQIIMGNKTGFKGIGIRFRKSLHKFLDGEWNSEIWANRLADEITRQNEKGGKND